MPARAVKNARLLPWMARLPFGAWRGMLRLGVRVSTRRAPERDYWRDYYGQAIATLRWPDLESRYRIAIDVDRAGPPAPTAVAAWAGRMLVLEAEHDAVANARARAELRTVFPEARFHQFAGAGHGLALDQPEAWLRVVTDFLQQP